MKCIDYLQHLQCHTELNIRKSMIIVCAAEYVVIYFISNSFLAMPIEERFRIVLANSVGSRIIFSLMQPLLSQLTRCRIREEANTASPPLKDSAGTTDVSI
jgi:hypothetical protein